MKIVVSGGTGVIGRAAVPALVAAGHDVRVLARSARNEQLITDLGATPVAADLFDEDRLTELYDGAEAVINLATHIPLGYSSVRPGAWRIHDQLRTKGVATVIAAARRAGVRRVVQESMSCLYAAQGDEWVTEDSPVEITRITEPVAVGESLVQDYGCDSRTAVLLRFGSIIGDDPNTRYWLRAAGHGRPVGFGDPEGWVHLMHTDDLGSAVVAALHAPTGVYNVGADPVRRKELIAGYAAAAGVDAAGFMGPVLRRMAGPRIEPLTRSVRVCSDHFAAQTGWRPTRSTFDASWFEAAQRQLLAASEPTP